MGQNEINGVDGGIAGAGEAICEQIINKNETHCPGPDCLSHWLRWMTADQKPAENTPAMFSQTMLFASSSSYDDAAPAIRNIPEFQQAVETLAFSIFRLNNNRLTRAERPRLENLVKMRFSNATAFFQSFQWQLSPPFSRNTSTCGRNLPSKGGWL